MSLILAALFLRALGHPTQLTLDPQWIQHLEGHAYQLELKRRLPHPWRPLGDHPFNLHRSDLLVFEDGKPTGRPHTSFDSVRDLGGGDYLHWGRLLIFSTPDGTDPRTNGRTYRVELTAGMDPRRLRRLADLGVLLILAAAVGLLWLGARRGRGTRQAQTRQSTGRRSDLLLAASVPGLLSLVSWWLVPPLWNGSDSVIWLLWQLTWIPHHPPLYPGLMAFLHGLDGDSVAMLNAARLIQHAGFILAVTYLASAFRRPWKILLSAAAASLGAGLGLFAHGFFTEGLAVPMLILFLGALLRLGRDGLTRGSAAMLFGTLLLASLTRHVLIVLAVVPLAFLFLQGLLQGRLHGSWRALGGALVLMAGVGIANAVVNGYVSLILDAQQVSILGRAGVYRIQAAYELVPEDRRGAWLADLQARAKDPLVGEALGLMALTPNPWTGPRDAIVEAPTLFGRHPDALMNAGFKTFAFAWEPYALGQWTQELGRAILGTGAAGYCAGQVSCLLQGTIASIERELREDPRSLAAIAGTGAEDAAAAAAYRRIVGQAWVKVADTVLPRAPLPRAIFLGLSLGMLTLAVALAHHTGSPAMALALWAGALVYALALTFVTVVLPRYLVPIDVLLWLANALVLMGLIESVGLGRAGQSRRLTLDRA